MNTFTLGALGAFSQHSMVKACEIKMPHCQKILKPGAGFNMSNAQTAMATDIQIHLQAWLGGHRLKEAQRAVQVRAIEGVAENQEPEGGGSQASG